MSAVHIETDLFADARNRIAVYIGVIMGRKHVPPSVSCCQNLAASVVETLSPAELFIVAHSIPDDDLTDRITWMANNILDWEAASELVHIFATVSGLADVCVDEQRRIVSSLLSRIKGENHVGARSIVWPLPEKIEAVATCLVSVHKPLSVVDLEVAIDHGIRIL